MFVRSCCNEFTDGVTVFRVVHIKPSRPAGFCSKCHQPLPHDRYAADQPVYGGAPLQWLKRIPPLSELEGERTQEDIREPA